MDLFSLLKSEMVSYLQSCFNDNEIAVVGEFPSTVLNMPPRTSCIAVGFSGAQLPACAGSTGQVKITLRFDIICPKFAKQSCHTVFNQLCDALICREQPFTVGEISCGDLVYDSGLCALLLTAKTTLNGMLVSHYDEDGVSMKDIIIHAKGV